MTLVELQSILDELEKQFPRKKILKYMEMSSLTYDLLSEFFPVIAKEGELEGRINGVDIWFNTQLKLGEICLYNVDDELMERIQLKLANG